VGSGVTDTHHVAFGLDHPLAADVEHTLRFHDVFDPVEHAELMAAVAIGDYAAAREGVLGGITGVRRRGHEGEQMAENEYERQATHDNTSQLLYV
jgi:hypothetical protein